MFLYVVVMLDPSILASAGEAIQAAGFMSPFGAVTQWGLMHDEIHLLVNKCQPNF